MARLVATDWIWRIQQSLHTRPGMCDAAHLFRVLVVHHPFVPSPNEPRTTLVGNGLPALRAAEECGVDLLLSGHLHYGHIADVRITHNSIRRAILAAQAGTAVSSRRRLEANTYNLITIDPPRLAFEVRIWDGRAFVSRDVRRFTRQGSDWKEG